MDSNVTSMMNCLFDTANSSLSFSTSDGTSLTGWGFWTDYYYPQVIYRDYPVYVRERAQDKGRKAFELIKVLKDKKLIKLEKVADFIDLMDELIKIL